MKSIDINEINKFDKSFVIDIREQEEWDHEHIKNTRHIIMNELCQYPEKYLLNSKRYYIMCAAGGRSLRACAFLESLGYDVVNLEKGIAGYIRKEDE